MEHSGVRDYADSGLDIQYAMIDHAVRFPDKNLRPQFILWHGRRIRTSDVWTTPESGIVRAEFLACKTDVHQGFDIKIDGWLELADGERVSLLRTWKDERFEDAVAYHFCSPNRRLWIWNVYKMTYPGGQEVQEKWTANAGFWVDQVGESERVYHCSHGMAAPPDFEALVFKVSVQELTP